MHKVHSIFPFPIYRADMKQKITEHDIDYIKNQKQKSTKNEGNLTSKENYLLNKKQLEHL